MSHSDDSYELGSQRSTNVEDSLEKKENDKRRRKGSSNTSLSLLLVFTTGDTIYIYIYIRWLNYSTNSNPLYIE